MLSRVTFQSNDGEGRMDGMLAAQSNSNELERLLLRMSRKDEAAFEKLHAATKRKLFSTVLRIVKRRHLAEEILQEAYVRIWLNAAAYRSSTGLAHDVDDNDRQKSRDRCRAKAGAGNLLRPFGHAGFSR